MILQLSNNLGTFMRGKRATPNPRVAKRVSVLCYRLHAMPVVNKYAAANEMKWEK